MQEVKSYVPVVLEQYVPWGHFDTVKRVIESEQFFPMWITGLAGNGKTQMIEQACATLGRQFVRINFTMETDEHDLLGGFRLVNGDTEFHEGPVVTALKQGAILLLDEVDAANCNKVLCLQSIMEGKGVLIKATGEWINPAPGFNVFATSNTKGRGSDDGKFMGLSIMNAAFLDRFGAMLYQDYPPEEIEIKIMQNYFVTEVWKDKENESCVSSDEAQDAQKFMTKLAKWANQIRENYANQSTEEVITTRSLIAIIKAYSIFGDKMQAIQMACERYDTPIRDSFVELYAKLSDDSVIIDPVVANDPDDDMLSFTPKQ